MQAINSPSFPHIAIIGGGPGGLTLARTLQVHGIPFTVFEREASPLARPQGGTLDLHVESGQRALRRAGLEAEFLGIARYEDQEDRLYDKHGRLLFQEAEPGGGDRPEVDRTQLRQVLLDSLPPATIRWGHKLQAVRPQADGRWEALFEKGERGVFDLIVGADGAWSQVRPLLSTALPAYSGVTFFEFGIDDVDRRHPPLAALVGRGKIMAFGDSKALIAQRNAHSHFRVYAALRLPEDGAGAIDRSSPARLKADLIATHYSDWAPTLLELIRSSEDWFAGRPIHALPIGHRWRNVPGLTLLGDAAHLMSPWGGEGVNLAMLDASDLALALARGGDWRAEVAAYETLMSERATDPATGAREGLAGALSEHAIEHFLEHMQQIAG